MKKSILFLLALLICFTVQAQQKQELWAYLENLYNKVDVKNKDKEPVFTGKEFVSKLQSNWTSGADAEVLASVQKLVERRYKPYPDISKHLEHIVQLAKLKPDASLAKNFALSSAYFLSKPGNNDFNLFAENIQLLVKDSAVSLYKSFSWVVNSLDFEIQPTPKPVVLFNNVNLGCVMNNNRQYIYNTSGVYDPVALTWKGKGGTLYWTKAGLPKDSVYTQLNRYTLMLQGTDLVADSALYINKKIIATGVFGKFEDSFKPGRPGLPRFKSYGTDVFLKDVAPDVDYKGGIVAEGKTIDGIGKPEHPATLIFETKNKSAITVKANSFNFSGKFLASKDAKVNIQYKNDSIYTPNISFVYDPNIRKVTLFQNSNLLSNSPYYDSYHKMEIRAGAIDWFIDDTIMSFTKGTGLIKEGDAHFISENYFRADDFQKVQGIDPVNPLVTLYKYSNKFKTRTFTINQFAEFALIQPDQLRLQIIKIASLGYLLFDLDTDKIILKDKLFHFVDSNNGKKDFDNLVVFSDSTRQNATINLKNLDLQVFSAPQVILSDSQKVMIAPYNYTLILKKNRDIAYAGVTRAGLFEFFSTKNNNFLYNEFRINLSEVDSLRFKVIDKRKTDTYGNPKLLYIESVIEKLRGNINIDDVDNKSGRKSYKVPYPTFKTDSSQSFVYYDRGKYGKRYSRKSFYYKVKPFKLNNLDNFMLDSLDLRGSLVSGGVFPEIKKPLIVRPDASLGIAVHTGKNGYNTYNQAKTPKGKFIGRVDLSHNGLRGDGQLRFLGSIAATDTTKLGDSTDYLFYPDRMRAQVKTWDLAESGGNVQYPQVTGVKVLQEWLPYMDKMNVKSRDVAFAMYNKKMSFKGSLVLSPEGLDGKGDAGFDKARLKSETYTFRQKELSADTAFFAIKSYDSIGDAFVANKFRAYVNFEKNNANFTANKGAAIKFPANEYKSTHTKFDWNIVTGAMKLTAPEAQGEITRINTIEKTLLANPEVDKTIGIPKFISLKPGQDSLQFFSGSADFDLNKNIITAHEVKFIRSGDATIFSPQGDITITQKIESIPIKNATLITYNDQITHEIVNADVAISSRKAYTGKGYTYYSDQKTKANKLSLSKISSDQYTGLTKGTGSVTDTSAFRLDENFDYYGAVKLNAVVKHLGFDGFFKINTTACRKGPNYWVKFDTLIDPKNIVIPIKKDLYSADYQKMEAGYKINRSTGDIYSCFMQPMPDPKDVSLFDASGVILYNKEKSEYRIGAEAVVRNPLLPGNMVSYNPDECMVRTKGRFDINPLFSPTVKFLTFGKGQYNLKNDSIKLNVLIAFDFPFLTESSQILVKAIEEANPPVFDINNDKYIRQLNEWAGEKDAELLRFDWLTGTTKAPASLKTTLLLTDIELKWDPVNQTWDCFGPLGIVIFNGKYVGRKVPGYLQLSKRQGVKEDILKLLIRLDDDHYYYFDYGKASILRIFSTNNDFVQAVSKERDAINAKYEKETESKRWQPYKISWVNKIEPVNFRAEMEEKNK